MILLQRQCIACRRMIPEDSKELLAIVSTTSKWNKTKHKHLAKPQEGEHPCLCETCAPKMLDIIRGQIEKGVKVI